MATNTPPSAAVKVRLLQDAIYTEDIDLWSAMQRYRTHIETYFRDIGLELVVHEEDGFAYLQQASPEDLSGIPALFRRDKISRGVAIIGVVLREQLLAFDETVHDESQLILRKAEIVELAAPFFPSDNDELRANKRIEAALNKAEEFGLIRSRNDPGAEDTFEVRRILKARFPVETLKELQQSLQGYVNG